MTGQSMTYCQLPSREQFDAAFVAEERSGRYRITLSHTDFRTCDGFKLGDGEWTPDQLWGAIREIVNYVGDEITVYQKTSPGRMSIRSSIPERIEHQSKSA